jgi:hypothetical protein
MKNTTTTTTTTTNCIGRQSQCRWLQIIPGDGRHDTMSDTTTSWPRIICLFNWINRTDSATTWFRSADEKLLLHFPALHPHRSPSVLRPFLNGLSWLLSFIFERACNLRALLSSARKGQQRQGKMGLLFRPMKDGRNLLVLAL